VKRLWGTLGGRLLICLASGMLIGLGVAPVAQLLLGDLAERAPQQIVLTIPAGTAERVAAGESSPSIPSSLEFVVGDTLVVRNEDSVSHQLGPMWIPAGGTGQLAITQASTSGYACSFRPSRTIDLRVRPRASNSVRAVAALSTGLPIAVLFAAYSLVMWPVGRRGAPTTGAPEPDGVRERGQ
jgi:hypothetical protein